MLMDFYTDGFLKMLPQYVVLCAKVYYVSESVILDYLYNPWYSYIVFPSTGRRWMAR